MSNFVAYIGISAALKHGLTLVDEGQTALNPQVVHVISCQTQIQVVPRMSHVYSVSDVCAFLLHFYVSY